MASTSSEEPSALEIHETALDISDEYTYRTGVYEAQYEIPADIPYDLLDAKFSISSNPTLSFREDEEGAYIVHATKNAKALIDFDEVMDEVLLNNV